MSKMFNAANKLEDAPGPGHYQLNIPDQIKFMTDKLAPRYKSNPFGSNISRFNSNSKGKKEPLMTEEEIRVRELVRDLEDHTGAEKGHRQGAFRTKLQN